MIPATVTQATLSQSTVSLLESSNVYKILIDIDGFTYSERFPKLLQVGSVIFKISVFTDIGSIVPRPWKHYVPIKFDLSDFEEKLEWARQNDDEIKQIAERGKEISQKVHSYKVYLCYTKTLLLKYHELRVKGRIKAENIQKHS